MMICKFLAISVFSLSIELIAIGLGQSRSPCPDVFEYATDPKTRIIYGLIKIRNVPKDVDIQMRIKMSVAGYVSEQNLGEVELAVSNEQLIEHLSQGQPLVYRVRFPIQQPLPLITDILLNNQRRCTGEKASGSTVSSVTLDHTLLLSGAGLPPENPVMIEQTSHPPYGTHTFDMPHSISKFPPFSSSNPFLHPTTNSPPNSIPQSPSYLTQSPFPNFTPDSPSFPMPNSSSHHISKFPSYPSSNPFSDPWSDSPPSSIPEFPPHSIPDFAGYPTQKPSLNSTLNVASTPTQPPFPITSIQNPSPTTRLIPNRNPDTLPYKKVVTEMETAVEPFPNIVPQQHFVEYAKCGQQYKNSINLLISKGDRTNPGDWPWLVAIFVSKNPLEFQCPGNLISDKHVLTAASCFQIGNGKQRPASELIAVLGRHQLQKWSEKGSEIYDVSDYKVHDDYGEFGTYDSNNLAVLTLAETVTFGELITPICLWSGLPEIENIVDRTGIVVGWGKYKDEDGHEATEEPRMSKVPIVSQVKCLRSNADFVTITSNRTFCGGARDGTGPCNGDSGAGLVMYDSEKQRYHLRGLVSLSLVDHETGKCDLSEFVVYTDVAQYSDWIRQQLHTSSDSNSNPPSHLVSNPFSYPTAANSPSAPQRNYADVNKCGQPSRNNFIAPFIDHNQRGDWPWLVALFVDVEYGLQLQCAGSLITNEHVLTAAHCLESSDKEKLLASTLLAAVGRYKLNSWTETGSDRVEVSDYTIHYEYGRGGGFGNDLAVLKLKEAVTFGDFIVPICLWEGSTDVKNIVGQSGIVVGWGQDEDGNPVTEEPRMITVPIVSQENCLRSNEDFVKITSERFFCAGARNGSGPCNGDSGAGLVMYDSQKQRYNLRGVVALSLPDRATRSCDSSEFVVYTDVAKFLDWIRQQIST